MKKQLKVVAALIKKDGKFLICQRKEEDSFGLLWEFPGGVVEAGETFKEAMEREVKEELDLEVKAKRLLRKFEDENEELKIAVHLFECLIIKGSPWAKDCRDLGFFSLKEMNVIKLAPVDAKILSYLKNLTSKKSLASF